jgi:serine/threonine-protein kinase
MPFTVGSTIGPYRIIDSLGIGGMGEVYRAHDTRLGREVALKVLPEIFARDPDRLTRFEREARVLASLNHPNIATLLDVKELDDRSVLEMELVPGDTLAERLERGAMSCEEALPVFRQIAQALEAAHERGIIHRDLKPSNIKLTPDGRVKVLDFGLAKAFEPPSGVEQMTQGPAATSSRTGAVLGTARYMSPEQARGRSVDRRTDIWSFGCVMFEAISGEPAFPAVTTGDALAAILRDEPDMDAVSDAPPALRRLIARCLRKDPQTRLRDIADARIEIEELLQEGALPPARVRRDRTRGVEWGPIAAVVAAVAAALVGAAWFVLRGATPAPAPLVRVTIPLGPEQQLLRYESPPMAISRDGSALAYVAVSPGARARLYHRSVDRFEPTQLPGTDGASAPFFSPDGEWVGFYAADALRRVPVRGGTPLHICDAPAVASATWGADDQIVFATTFAGDGLFVVGASGATPQSLTRPDHAKGELRHVAPQRLPDGDSVLFTVVAKDGMHPAILSLSTRQWRVASQVRTTGGYARYASSGHLLYAEGGALAAVPFDIRRAEVRGAPLPLLERVTATQGTGAYYDVSENGSLVYVPGRVDLPHRTMLIVDREGRATPLTELPGAYAQPRFSPDGRWVAVTIESESGSDIWLHDLRRGTRTRLTSGGTSSFPVWAPETGRVIFHQRSTSVWTLFARSADGSGPTEAILDAPPPDRGTSEAGADLLPGNVPTLSGANPQVPMSWHARTLAFVEMTASGENNIWTLETGGEPTPFLMSPFDERSPAFSADGRWIAYVSDESGRDEVYLQPYPGPGGKWLISTEGGADPSWSADGRQIFYRRGSQMMAVTIQTEPAFSAGTPQPLFEGRYDTTPLARNYDVSPDGRQFVLVRTDDPEPPPRFHLVLNWIRQLERGLPQPPN